MVAVERVWEEQGGYGLVDHVPRYRMVRFGRNLTQVEGAGGDTVKNRSCCQLVKLLKKKRLNTVHDFTAKWGPLLSFSHLFALLSFTCLHENKNFFTDSSQLTMLL